MDTEFGIKDVFNCPSNTYIFESRGKFTIRILDNLDEDSLMSASMNKRAYELLLGDKFKIFYGISLPRQVETEFKTKNRKSEIYKQICKENNISIFYRDDEKYFSEISSWNEIKNVNINKQIITLYENKEKLKLTTTKSIQKAIFEKFFVKVPLKYIINLLG
jgi:hypothetical protein